MKDYFNDVMVWGVIGGIAVILYLALFKKRRNFVFLLGMLLIIGALPAGFMLEFSATGCCGAPASPYQGIGFVLGAVMLLLGFVFVIISIKKRRGPKIS